MAKKQRVDKILTHLGYGTRKEIRDAVRKGVAKVDDVLIKDPGFQMDPENQKLVFMGEEVFYREFVYLMMNKPQGVVSSTEDRRDETVIELLDPKYHCFDLFPVGRLDKDTEGLLILSNDGVLAHNILTPKKHIPKTYYAKINGRVSDEDIVAFKEGITLEDGTECLPATLRILEHGKGNTSEIEVVLMEGKYHQVKRMFEAVGKQVTYLQRIQMGQLTLDGSLELGEYRELTEEELLLLQRRE